MDSILNISSQTSEIEDTSSSTKVREEINEKLNVRQKSYAVDKGRLLEKFNLAKKRRHIVIKVKPKNNIRMILSEKAYRMIESELVRRLNYDTEIRKMNKIKDTDKEGVLIDTVYKITNADGQNATMTLYHTTRTVLINGNAAHEIMKVIETNIDAILTENDEMLAIEEDAEGTNKIGMAVTDTEDGNKGETYVKVLDTFSNCTECDATDTIDMIECKSCHKWTHYLCTKLPAYQVTALVTSTRRYDCRQCVEPNNEMDMKCVNYDKLLNEIKRAKEELERLKGGTHIDNLSKDTVKINELETMLEMTEGKCLILCETNRKVKESNDILESRTKALTRELESKKEMNKNDKGESNEAKGIELIACREEVKTKNKLVVKLERSKKDLFEETVIHESIIKAYKAEVEEKDGIINDLRKTKDDVLENNTLLKRIITQVLEKEDERKKQDEGHVKEKKGDQPTWQKVRNNDNRRPNKQDANNNNKTTQESNELNDENNTVRRAVVMQETDTSNLPCKFATRGDCRYGDKCRFKHPTPQSKKDKKKPKSMICDKYNSSEGCDQGQCKYLHKKRREQTCKFYINGKCDYGEYCIFQHKAEDNNQEEQILENVPNKSHGMRELQETQKYIVDSLKLISSKLNNNYNQPCLNSQANAMYTQPVSSVVYQQPVGNETQQAPQLNGQPGQLWEVNAMNHTKPEQVPIMQQTYAQDQVPIMQTYAQALKGYVNNPNSYPTTVTPHPVQATNVTYTQPGQMTNYAQWWN